MRRIEMAAWTAASVLFLVPHHGAAFDLGGFMDAASAVQGVLNGGKLPTLPGKRQTVQGAQAERQAQEREAENARQANAPAAPDPAAAPALPPPAPAGTYALGTVDLTTTALITRQIDKSHGFAYTDETFSFQRPKFASEAARSLYERSIDQPMDPAYYATKRWALDPGKAVALKAEIEALTPADQAQVLANLLLLMRGTESHALQLLKSFPQLEDIEYVWMRPKLTGNGQLVTVGGGDPRRGNVWAFLNSDVIAGVPNITFVDRSQNFPLIGFAISSNNTDGWKRILAKGRPAPVVAAAVAPPSFTNVRVEYHGAGLDEAYTGPRTSPGAKIPPIAPGVTALSIRLELELPSITPNTKYAIDSSLTGWVDWAPVDGSTDWKHAKVVAFEVSDGVRTMRMRDHVGTMRIGFTTDAAGQIVAWGMKADAPFVKEPMTFDSSNRNANSLCSGSSKFMDTTLFRDTQLRQFASKGCTPGVWTTAAER